MRQSEGMFQPASVVSDRYEVLGFLGGGEATEVYKVKDIIGNRVLAMKVLREGASKEAALRLSREFFHLSRLSHPGIVRAIDYGTSSEHRPFFTMEFSTGVSIRSYFPDGYAPEVEDVAAQVLQVLGGIHDQGLVHCDIKPDHILIENSDNKPKVKMLDFGFAERVNLAEAAEPRGTLGYIAPEVFKGTDADARADLYSLGMVLYEILTGQGPSGEKDLRTWLKKQYYTDFDPPRKFDPKIPTRFESVVMSMIHKEPDRRPRSAAAVMRDIAGAAVQSKAIDVKKEHLMAPSFVGRAEPLKRLGEMLTKVSEGQASVVCLSGERGVGKSRLMSEFKFMAQLEGATILSFEPASLGARPQSLVESILNHLQVYGGADLPSAVDADRASISEEGKFRLFETVIQRLRELAASDRVRHSVVLIVDDFELFDPSSLEFLRYLGFSLNKDRIAVMVCGLKEKRFLDLIEEFGRTDHCFNLSLEPMVADEIKVLVGSLLGEVPQTDDLTKWLVRTAGGNPLFTLETVRALIEGDVLVVRDGRWNVDKDELEAYRPPETVTDVVRRRLKSLSEEEMEVLEIGAAAGGPFTLEFLRTVLKYDEKLLFGSISRLRSLGLLRSSGVDGSASLILSSKILEAVITERLPVEERRENHRRVALALELLYPGREDRLVFDLAHHYTQAGIQDRAYAYSVRAGARAREYQISDQALEFYETALAIAPKTIAARERVDLMMLVGELREATGKSAEAIDIYTQGMSVIVSNKELSKQKELLAKLLRKLGFVYQRRGQNDEALNYFSQALLMLKERIDPDYIQTLNDLGWSYCSAENYDKAESLLTQALQLTEKTKNQDPDQYKRLSARTLYYFSVLAWSRYDFVLALQLAERSLSLYEALGDGHNTSRVSQFLATLWWRRGELGKAKEYYEKFLPSQREGGEVYLLLRTLQGLGIISQDEGEWDRAFHYYAEALRLAERIGDRAAVAYLNGNLGLVCDERGDWSDALRFLELAWQLQQRGDVVYDTEKVTVLSGLAKLKGKMGELEEADGLLAKARDLAEKTRNPDMEFFIAVDQAELALHAEKLDVARGHVVRAFGLGRHDREWRKGTAMRLTAAQLRIAEGDYAKSLNDSRRALLLLKDYPSSKEYAIALRWSGLAKCYMDKHERGTQEIRRSIDLLRSLGSKYELGLSLLASAQALTKQTRGEQVVDLKMPISLRPVPESDLADAQTNLKEAEDIFRLLGAQIELARTDEFIEVLTQVSATMQLKSRERGEYLKVFYRLSELMSMGLEKEDFADRVLDLIVEVTRAERGILFLVQGSKLVPVAARGIDRATIEDAMAVSQSVMRKVRRRGEIVFSADALADPRFSAANSVVLNQIRSLLCAPLRVDNRVIGTVYLDSRVTAHLFLEEDKNLLGSVANLLGATIDKSTTFQQLQEDMDHVREDILVDAATGAFLGRSKPIREVYKVIDRIAPTDCTVLLTGETGTGKGVLARLVHSKSERRDKKFVSINCGTLPENLFESELFGHAKGSFTGAVRDKDGLFEIAEGGTVFLDEITNTSLGIQAKLLQVLEEKVIRRVGETQTRMVDARLICATNRDLEVEVRKGTFREDLFYRINVVTIQVPPLRDRATDIAALADFFVKRYAKQLNKPIAGFEDRVLAAFAEYDWPGNVRELQNVIERAVIMSQKRRVTLEDLGGRFGEPRPETEVRESKRRRIFDREQVLEALRETDGNVTKAAELLATHRRQLQRLMKRYRIDRTTVS